MKHVIFVCTGNTCRSPMAEVLFQNYLKERGLDELCYVESRGLMANDGEPAAEYAKKVVADLGLDLTAHSAKSLMQEDLAKNSYFICMTDSHAAMLMQFAPKERILSLGISDPFGGDENCYKACAEEIQAALPKVFRFVFSFDEIRPMQDEDIKAVWEIENASFSVPWTETGLKEGLQNETGRFLVAVRDNVAVGYIGANCILDEAYLNNVAVLPQYRKNGIARALLVSLISRFKAQNTAFVSLEVRTSNEPAISLYKSLGFTQRGIRKNFYSEPSEDALILTKDL